MPSKPSRAKYLTAINLPHSIGSEPLPRTGPWWGLLTPWKDEHHRLDPAWLREHLFFRQQRWLQGLGVLLEKKNNNSYQQTAATIHFVKKALKALCLTWQITRIFYF